MRENVCVRARARTRACVRVRVRVRVCACARSRDHRAHVCPRMLTDYNCVAHDAGNLLPTGFAEKGLEAVMEYFAWNCRYAD